MTDEIDKRDLVLHALASYADSCTLPSLTPNCPFYLNIDGTATCGEQCRGVAEEMGGQSRPITEQSVGGLTMIGRPIPITAIAPHATFDAAQLYISQRGLALSAQSTSSLFLSLRTVIARDILSNPTESSFSALEIWGELARRGIDMERVAAGGLVRSLAPIVALRTIVDGLGQADRVAEDRVPQSPWTLLLDLAFAAFGASGEYEKDEDANAVGIPLSELLAAMGTSQETEALSEKYPQMRYALSRDFLDRVSEWLIHRVADDLESGLSGEAPSAEIFLAITPSAHKDQVGRWVWERFTLTDLNDWRQSSLVLEWKWARSGEADLCTGLVLNERLIPADEIADRVLMEMSASRNLRTPAQTGLHAGMFVEKATQLLIDGKWTEATQIFAALVDLRPGDAEAWNNQGFCELAGNPESAFALLSRAERLTTEPKAVLFANQALALHLLSRDAEALEYCARGLESGSSPNEGAYLWAHPTDLGELELVHSLSPRRYLEKLRIHIESAICEHSLRVPSARS